MFNEITRMKKMTLASFFVAIIVINGFLVYASPATESPGLSLGARYDLSNVYSFLGLLGDTNEDTFPDFVNATIVLAAKGDPTDVVGACSVAARLGFETMGIILPITKMDREVVDPAKVANPILIGRSNELGIMLRGKAPINVEEKQGIVQVVPMAFGTYDALVVAGKDDVGTRAAAEGMAMRLPYLWDVGKGEVTLEDIENAVSAFLVSGGASIVGRPSSVRIVYEHKKASVVSLTVEAETATNKDRNAAVQLLQGLKRDHVLGLRTNVLSWPRLDELVVAVCWEKTSVPVKLPRSVPPAPAPPGLTPELPASQPYDLSSPYTLKGFLEDTDVLPTKKDFIPDSTRTVIVIGGGVPVEESLGAVDVAARIGLETCGVDLPIAKLDTEVVDPAKEPNPILVGKGNKLVMKLVEDGKLTMPDLEAKEGVLQIVPQAFGTYTALVAAGASPVGTRAALSYMAEHLSSLWETRRGEITLEDIETSAGDFFAVISSGGQAAEALMKVDEFIAAHKGETLGIVQVNIYMKEPNPDFEDFIKKRIQDALAPGKVEVKTIAMKSPVAVIDREWTLRWEVSDFWDIFNTKIAPNIVSGQPASIELRVSEPPEVRQQIRDEIIDRLKALGADPISVTVLSAYKLGYTWLTEVVAPAVKGKNVDTVVVTIDMNFRPPTPTYEIVTRWVHELFPADEVIAPELGITKDDVIFKRAPVPSANTYQVVVNDTDGNIIYTGAINAKWDTRLYCADVTSGAGLYYVCPSTGWVTASSGGSVIADERIVTDMEKAWDCFQYEMQPLIKDYVLTVLAPYLPNPTAAQIRGASPLWRTLTFDLYMSEADYPIMAGGKQIYEEIFSPIESMLEDLYFVTYDWIRFWARFVWGSPGWSGMTSPGQVIPNVYQRLNGDTTFRLRLNKMASLVPKIEILWDTTTEEATLTGAAVKKVDEWRFGPNLPYMRSIWPSAVRSIIEAGEEDVNQVKLDVAVETSGNLSKAGTLLDKLKVLHEAGLFTDSLSWYKLKELLINVIYDTEVIEKSLPRVAPPPPPPDTTPPGPFPIVPWDHPISNDECYEIAEELNKFPEINAWICGESYLGREMYVLEVMLPVEAELWSQAKASTYKTTFYLTSCGHANEVSSINAQLRFAELLARDPEYRKYLYRTNFVILPIKNPDGTDVVMEQVKDHPTFMLHTGRYNSAGVGVGTEPEKYTEGLATTRTSALWIPDAVVTDHGFPHHEWVQIFSGYVPKAFRTYWINRGTVWLDATAYKCATEPLLYSITVAQRKYQVDELNADAEIMEWITHCFEQYYKYGNQWLPGTFPITEYRGMIYYWSVSTTCPSTALSTEFGVNRYLCPINYYTEVSDEVAWGNTMEVCARTHFLVDLGVTKVLYESTYEYIRTETEIDGTAFLSLRRYRPFNADALVP